MPRADVLQLLPVKLLALARADVHGVGLLGALVVVLRWALADELD